MKIFNNLFLFFYLILLIKANEIPFSIIPGLFDSSKKETMGLELVPGIETVTVFSAEDDTNHYNNGVVMTWFKNNLYCMWQTSPRDEDSYDTMVVYSISEDMGKTWSPPKNLSTPIKGYFCTSLFMLSPCFGCGLKPGVTGKALLPVFVYDRTKRAPSQQR